MSNENHLCPSCRKIDFQGLFFAHGTLDKTNCTRSLKAIRNATNCSFCRLTLSALNSNPNVRKLENASCTMRAEEFGTLVRSKSAPNMGPTINPWTLSEVESKWGGIPQDSRARFKSFIMPTAIREALSATDLESSPTTPLGPTINRLWFTLSSDMGSETEPDETTIFHGIQIFATESVREKPQDALLRGRRVNLTVDVHLLKEWLETCMHGHGEKCCPRGMPGMKSFCFRLIDINRRCVVQAPFYCRYYALSYTWGKLKQPLLTDSTIHRFTTDGGLSDDQPDITRTLKDALYLCELLGQQYLWIDTLCIKQDSREDKEQQIDNMGQIYSCAELTIVSAAGSDSSSGLPGLRTGSRATRSHIESLPGLQIVTAHQPFLPCISNTTWESRGWTFQEKALSQRLLIFTGDQVFYHCNTATWSEDTVLENPDRGIDLEIAQDITMAQFSKSAADLEVFEAYENFARNYASRSITVSSDIPNAFKGIEELLKTQFGIRDFLYGLPIAFFNEALLWSSGGHFPDRRLKEFPSWSWMGWKNGGEGIPIHFDRAAPLDRRFPGDVMWHRPCEGGGFVFITIDEVVNLDDRELSKLVQYFWSGVKNQPFHYSPSTMPPLSQLITASCRVWSLEVGYEGIESGDYEGDEGFDGYEGDEDFDGYEGDEGGDYEGDEGDDDYGDESGGYEGCSRYPIQSRTGSYSLGAIDLNIRWREAQPAQLDFVQIDRDGETSARYMMLIEWQDGIAYRVQRPVEPFVPDGSYRDVLVTFG